MYKTCFEILEYAVKQRRVEKASKLSFSSQDEAIEQNENIDLLTDIGFLKPLGGDRYEITYSGRKAFKDGNLDTTISNKFAEKNRASKKDVFEYKISKWKYFTFWPIFFIGLFGGVYSSIDFIKSLSKQENDQQEQITKEEMEEELSKLRTLILNQKKDSLSNPSNYLLKK